VPRALRIIKQTRWYWRESPPSWLAEGEFLADVLLDFGTRDGALSIWLVEEDNANLEQLQTALMAARGKADVLDYLLFDREILSDCGIEVQESSGDTPDEEANNWHCDVIHLTGPKLLELVKQVCASDIVWDRIQARQARQMIADAVRSGRIPLQQLQKRLRDDMVAYLNQGG
jgi:hypothetical protein